MREKLTHFSREIARNARKDLYSKSTHFERIFWLKSFSENQNQLHIIITSNNFQKLLSINGRATSICKKRDFTLKITQYLVKLGPKLAKNGRFFSQFLAAAFLARNVSQNHFSFSREMREMCMSTYVKSILEKLEVLKNCRFCDL